MAALLRIVNTAIAYVKDSTEDNFEIMKTATKAYKADQYTEGSLTKTQGSDLILSGVSEILIQKLKNLLSDYINCEKSGSAENALDEAIGIVKQHNFGEDTVSQDHMLARVAAVQCPLEGDW